MKPFAGNPKPNWSGTQPISNQPDRGFAGRGHYAENAYSSIPEDVMKAATAACDALSHHSGFSDLQEAIARAIMAERERCASIDFEPIVAQFVACLGDDGLPCDHFCRCNAAATDIANAIRKGEA